MPTESDKSGGPTLVVIEKMILGTQAQLMTASEMVQIYRFQGAVLALQQLRQNLTEQQDSDSPD